MSLSLCLVVAGGFTCARAQSIAQQERSLFEAAEADWSHQQFDQALQKYREFVQLYPNSPLAPDAHFQIGYYLSYVASADEAIAEYQQTIALAPGTHDAHEAKVGIAALKFWQQDLEGAYDLFRQVLVETQDWAMIKECVFRMKELDHLIQLQKIPEQRNAMVDCGPKSLEMILEQKHIKTSDQEMRTMISLGQAGATMEQLKEASERKGLAAWGVKVNTAQLRTLPSPFIVHIRPDHFVVVTNATKDKIEFTDPHKGVSYRTKEKFEKIWQGYALVFAKDVPRSLRSQLLTKAEMDSIRGGHHLHGMNLGGADGNPASDFLKDLVSKVCGPGLPHWSVNMSNYNFLVTDTDFAYAGRGPAVSVTRLYNADDPREGIFGRSWTSNYEVFLTVSPNGNVDVKREDGKVDNFMARGDGTFDPPRWVHDQLLRNADGTYKLLLKNSKLTESFNAQGKLSQITDRNNNSVTLQYDANNRLISVTDAVGRITQFTYSGSGKVSQITDPINRKATFAYDTNNNLISTTDMAGNVSSFTYNGTSYMTSLTTPNGTTQVHMGTTPHFTEFPGLLKDIVDPLGNTQRFDTGDFIAWIFDARGNQTFYFNDSLGQTTEIEDALGNKRKYAFNGPNGELTRITDANGNATNFTYDARGNVISFIDALGKTSSFIYDSRDNLIQFTDPSNHVTSYQYDAKDNVTKMTDFRNGVTVFTYDALGEMLNVTDRRGNKTSFSYDANGNLTSISNPVGGVTSNSFDAVGRLISQVDPKSQTFGYVYDGIDRVTRITQPAGTVNYNYGCCKLGSVVDSSGTISLTYDAANRLIKLTDINNQTIQYAYDPNGNLTGLTYPDGKVVRYEYDSENRLVKVTDWLNDTTTYKYDAAGNLTAAANSNGTFTGYQYDSAVQLTGVSTARTNSSIIAANRFVSDSLGNRSEIAVFPLVASPPSAKNISYTYAPDDRPLSSSNATYTHDANGNLITVSGPSSASYSYDAFNRLIQAATPGQTTQYQYDAFGNRTRRIANGTTAKFVVAPVLGRNSQLLAETDGAGNITSYYVYGQGLISKIAPTNQAYFYHYDGSGNTIAVTDMGGNIQNQYGYDTFGGVSNNSTEGIANPFRFAGSLGVIDEGNGLLYMRARYYSSGSGRFLSKDPLGLRGQNQYLYAANNPVIFVDPTGLITCTFQPPGIYRGFNPRKFFVGLSWGVSSGAWAGAFLGGSVDTKATFAPTLGLSTPHTPYGSASAGLSVGGGVSVVSAGIGVGISYGPSSGFAVGYECDLCK